ncbi:MAG: PAS domain S-box protein [Gallionella sp.]
MQDGTACKGYWMNSKSFRNRLNTIRYTPAGFALLYAALAALWIVLSTCLLTFTVADPLLQSRIELAKGLGFVAVTSGLLYLLLDHWHASHTVQLANLQTEHPAPPGIIRLVLIFIALVLLVPLIDLAVYELNVPEIEKHTFDNLNSIAKLKSEEIENWLDERSGDAQVLADNTGFARQVEQFLLHQQHDGLPMHILNQFGSLQANYGYDSILLLDNDGHLLTSVGQDVDNLPRHLLRQAQSSRQVQFGNLYRDDAGRINLDWVVPIIVSDQHGKHAVAAVVLRVLPGKFLYPLIQNWPTASPSGETLLVRRDGASILHLSPLRREPGAALTLKMHDPLLPAATAIRENKPGKVAGTDYRHRRVLAVYRPVAGTDWHLIAKIDRNEVMVPLWNMLYWISLIAFIAVGLIAGVLLLYHRQMQRSHQLALRAIAAEATQESELRYRTLVETIPDMVWLKNAEGIYLGCNPAFERLYGAREADLIGKRDYDFIDREQADFFRKNDLKAIADAKPIINEEWLTMASDGYRGLFEVIKSPLHDDHGNLVGVLGIARDITKRKHAEESILKLSQAVEQSPSSIVITDLDANIEYANAAFAKESGYSLDEVIGSNPRLLHSGKTPKATYADMWAHLTNGRPWEGEFINRRKDGSEYIELAMISPVFGTDGTMTNYLAIKENITEHIRMTEALRKSGEDLNRLLNSMAEGVYGIDNDGVCTFVNQSFLSILGYQNDTEVLGKHIHELIHHSYPDGSPYPESACMVHYTYQTDHSITSSSEVFWRKDGVAVPVEYWSHTITSNGTTIGAIVTFFDITERKADEAKIARLTQLYSALSQCNLAIVRCASEQELFLKICQNAVQFGGMTMAWIGLVDEASKQVRPVAIYGNAAKYLEGIRVSVDAVDPAGRGPTGTAIRENRPYWCQDFEHDPALEPWRELGIKAGWKAVAALPLHRNGSPSGILVLYSDTVNAFDAAARMLLTEMAADISFALDNFTREAERKQAVQEIEFKNIILQTQQETTLDAILTVDENGRIISHNQQFVDMWSAAADLVDKGDDAPLLQSVVDECLDPQGFLDRVNYLYQHHGEKSHEEIFLKDGRILDRYSAPLTGADGHYYGRIWYFRDITRRKHAEQELTDSEQRFRGLVEQSLAGIYIIQDNKVIYANPRAAEILGQNSADDLIKRDPLYFVAEADRSKVAEAMRKLFERERDRIALEFTALFRDGHEIVIGANASFASYHGKPAIIGLIQDISEKKRDEERIQNYVTQLKATFLSTVQLATSLSEMRDPYTAGHERRVSEIAVAIATEMGMDETRLEGIKVAGYLHDIGKISIPSEILVKPGRLNATEYALVQGHAQASYDVLKHVEFPWPVATIALQHHERIDGSGYPNGLKGDGMLLESRIMAVADVVEAMASHRPYRPGLGIDKALAELERGRGTVYDLDVVDTCLRLFRNQGFELPPY